MKLEAAALSNIQLNVWINWLSLFVGFTQISSTLPLQEKQSLARSLQKNIPPLCFQSVYPQSCPPHPCLLMWHSCCSPKSSLQLAQIFHCVVDHITPSPSPSLFPKAQVQANSKAFPKLVENSWKSPGFQWEFAGICLVMLFLTEWNAGAFQELLLIIFVINVQNNNLCHYMSVLLYPAHFTVPFAENT